MKYIFFDIDGTLLSHQEGISESTIETLRLFKKKMDTKYLYVQEDHMLKSQKLFINLTLME